MGIELIGVTKVFRTRAAERVAVDDVSMTIERGRFHTLLGPSGCGKTTLLRLLAGFEQPTAGEIVHDGRSLNAVPPYARGFPMVFQSYALFPHMTVAENVGYGLRVRGVDRHAVRQRVEQALALLGLGEERGRHPGQLSGGQQQRVALARCLVTEPDVILLDEPLSSLDAELRVAMRAEIRSLQQRLGITVVHVTHDQEEALAVADVIIVMNRGRVEQLGAPEQVFERPRTEFVARFMGRPNIVPVQPSPGGVVLLGRSYAGVAVPDRARLAVVRPDAVRLQPGSAAQDGTVEAATYLGTHVEYRVRHDTGEVLTVAGAAGAARLETGTRVAVEVAAARLHFLA